jgi:uncharacterized metal-binding protein
MPNARDHSLLTAIACLSIGASAAWFVEWYHLGIAIAAALLGDLFLSPDLDHDSGSLSYRAWGPLRFIWYPYMKLVPHRSAVSHFPLLGTVGRVLYLGVPIYVIALLCGHDLRWLALDPHPATVAILVGLEISNSLHFIADNVA